MVYVGSAYCAVGKVERARQQQILQGVESDAVAEQLAYRLAHVDVVVFPADNGHCDRFGDRHGYDDKRGRGVQ